MADFSWTGRSAPVEWPDDEIVGTKGSDSLTGTDGDDVMRGRRGDDSVQGGLGHDLLYGNAGDDWLDGGAGADTMKGGFGNDTYRVDDPLDQTLEKADGGVDTVVSSIDWVLGERLENLVLDGEVGSFLHGTGNSQDNVISATFGQVTIDGLGGNDTLVGAFHVAKGQTDVLSGGEGNDSIAGGDGSAHWDRLYGGVGNDTLRSAGGELFGDDGEDWLVAGLASTELTGGAGSDTFELATVEAEGRVFVVSDFATLLDHLAISESALPVGDGDRDLEGAVEVTGPGGFDASAELVVVTTPVSGPLTVDAAAAAIGSADQAYAVGQTVLFVAGNGSQTGIFYFSSLDGDSNVSAAELSFLAHVFGSTPGLQDFVLTD